MPYPNLTRSLLALAIAGVSVHASATTINLSDKPIKIEDQTFDSLTVTGKYIGIPEEEGEGFDFYSSTVKGNLILEAHIETEEVGDLNAQAFQTEDGAKIGGDLINLGHLEVRGIQAEAFELNRTTIGGSLVNEGTVVAKGGTNSGYSGDDITSGLVVRETTVSKDVHNKGSILSSVKDVSPSSLEINLHGINIEGSDIGGSLINSGNITVEGGQAGNSSTGIMIQDHKAKTDDDGILHPYRTTNINGQIQNSGTITATGNNDAVGVRFGDGFTVKGGLHNTGAIHGDTAGIQLDGNGGKLDITQAGGVIRGGDYAINQGNNTANLTLAGGEIDGKLNVNNINVTGAGTIGTDDITANQLTISNGGHLTLSESTQLNTNLNLAGGEITSDSINVSSGKKLNVTGSALVNTNTVKADQLTVNNGGKLTLSKTTQLDTDLNLAGGEISGGEFTVDTINVSSSGTITADTVNISSSSLTVNAGNKLFLQGKNGTIKINVADLTVSGGTLGLHGDVSSGNALLDVNGDLTFEAGSTVSLSGVKGFTLEGKEYLLIKAGDIIDNTNNTLFNGNMLVEVSEYTTDNGELKATVALVEGDKLVELAAAAGASRNGQAAAREVSGLMDSLTTNGNASYAAFAASLEDMSDAEIVQAIEQMTPDVDGGAVVVANQAQALINGAALNRTTALRGQSSGAGLSEAGVWAQGLYSDARQGTRNGVAGYNAYTSGMAIGADAKVTDNLTVGAAYGYMDATVNSKRGNTTEVDGHSFAVYAGYELGNYFIDSSLIYSKNENKSKRQIVNTTAKGTYDSNTLGLSVLGGYDFKLDSMTVSPLVGMNYSNTKLDGFTEKGSPAALRNGSQRYEIAELGAGARLSASYPLGQGRLEPQVQAMVYHDFAADRAKSTSAFVNSVGGSSFVAYGARPERTSYEANLGVDYKIGAFTVGGSYGYVGKKGFDSDTFAAKVRYDF